MRNWKLTTACLVFVSGSLAPAQGTFQNLDFESPNVANLTNLFVAFSDAFPGWTGYVGTNQATGAGYNFISGGAALTSLVTPTAPGGGGAVVINGNYSAALVTGETGPVGGTIVPVAIAQTALIPISARSLRFSASANVNYLVVMFSCVTVPFSAVGVGPNYTIYAGDIQPFAGLTGELRFTEQAASFGPGLILDDIQFSNISIPEPNVTSLAVLAALLLGWPFFRRRRR